MLDYKSKFNQKNDHLLLSDPSPFRNEKTPEKLMELKVLFEKINIDGSINNRSFYQISEIYDLNSDSYIFVQVLKTLVRYSMPILTMSQLVDFIYEPQPKGEKMANSRRHNRKPSKKISSSNSKRLYTSVKGIPIPKLEFNTNKNYFVSKSSEKSIDYVRANINVTSRPSRNNKQLQDDTANKSNDISLIFDSIDTKNKGKIKLKNFKNVIEDLNIPLTNDQLKLAFYFGDNNKDGKLDLTDFLKIK